VVCLDSGCGNYDQLWCTTSLRGVGAADVKVEVLTVGVHSGGASGSVASSFRVLRPRVGRIEDGGAGRILGTRFPVAIPMPRRQPAKVVARVRGDRMWKRFPWAKGTKPMSKDVTELILNRTWRPFVELIGIDGVPSLDRAGNVLR